MLARDDIEPAEPFALIRICPDRRIAGPQRADGAFGAPLLRESLRVLFDVCRQFDVLRIDARSENRGTLLRDRAEQLVESFGEQLHAVFDQRIGNRVERNAALREIGKNALGIRDVLLKAIARLAVIAESIECRRRHGVDRVAADQLLDIEDIAVGFVLGAGGRPQQTLNLRALRG